MRLLLAVAALLVAAAFTAVGIQILVTGELPEARRGSGAGLDLAPASPSASDPRGVGATAVGMGLVAGLVGLALLRSRARERAERRLDLEAAARLGLDPRTVARSRPSGAWKPIAAVGAGVALLAARFGDDLARHADDLDGLRSARSFDAVFGQPAAGVRAATEEDFFEDALEAVGLLLDANDVREAYELARAASGEDCQVVARVAVTETHEVYRRVAEDRYTLIEQRHVRHSSLATDGVITARDVVEDTAPLDSARGESQTLVLHSRRIEADGREVAELTLECRLVLHESADGDAVAPVPSAFTIPNEVELVGATWDDTHGAAVVTLRTTAAGRARAAAAWAAVMRDSLAARLTPEALGAKSLAIDAHMPPVAEATLTLTGDTLTLAAPGATTLDLVARGKR